MNVSSVAVLSPVFIDLGVVILKMDHEVDRHGADDVSNLCDEDERMLSQKKNCEIKVCFF